MLGNALVIWWGLTHSMLHILSVFCFKTPLLSRKSLFLVWHDVIEDSTSTHFNYCGFEIFNVLHYCCVGPFWNFTNWDLVWAFCFSFYHLSTYCESSDDLFKCLANTAPQSGLCCSEYIHLVSLLLLHYGDRASQCTLSSASKLWNHNDGH